MKTCSEKQHRMAPAVFRSIRISTCFFIVGALTSYVTSHDYQSRFLVPWHQPLCHSSQIRRSCLRQELILGAAQVTQSLPVKIEMGEIALRPFCAVSQIV
jgi:hypothetical protein